MVSHKAMRTCEVEQVLSGETKSDLTTELNKCLKVIELSVYTRTRYSD